MDPAQREAVERLSRLIENIQVAMLATVEDDGCIRSRPMATQRAPFDGQLWFFTDADTGKVHDIERERHVCVSFSSPEDNRFVSVSGLARVVDDAQKAKELWTPMLRAWFPEGPTSWWASPARSSPGGATSRGRTRRSPWRRPPGIDARFQRRGALTKRLPFSQSR